MHFSMKISYLFSSVYGRARGGGSSAYCGTGGSAWWSHWIYLSCYIVDFPCDESQILTDPSNKESVTFSPTNVFWASRAQSAAFEAVSSSSW